MISKEKMITLVAGVLTIIALGDASASANAFCDAKVATYRDELQAKADPAIAEIDNGIAEIRKSQHDPNNIAFKMADGSFKTLPQLRDLLIAQKAAASKEIDTAADKCANDLKPLQDASDAAVTLATGGLNKLLPERMTHIEIGEILDGKPLGGDGALIPHFRDQLLAAIHVDPHDKGFVTSIIVDPINTILGRR
jgi:hypothetical protein